jgi:hypothetical protein
MKFRSLQWLGLTVILQTGLIHLYLAPESFAHAAYEGVLFCANAIGALVAAYGIYRGKAWGWNLGLLIAAGSIVAYIVSRTVGLPGIAVEDWSQPLGLGSLAVESAFLVTCLMLNPWTTLVGSQAASLGIPATDFPVPSRYSIPAVSAIVVVLVAFTAYQWWSHQPGAILISQQELEEKYGLRVSLLGATAMNSIVDLRMKVLDAEKASAILSAEHHDALGLMVAGDESDIITAAHMSRHGTIVKTGGIYFTFFPNRQNAVRSGTPVNVVFGNLRLEPIAAQ